MIFVTVGHQMPFDRLIEAVDRWARQQGRADVFAQIGATDQLPQTIGWEKYLSPEQFDQQVAGAEAIVAHAGIGTIIAALKLHKPLLVLPRRAALGETRNDHQVATAQYFEQHGYVMVADEESELPEKLSQLASFKPLKTIGESAPEPLLLRLGEFAFGK